MKGRFKNYMDKIKITEKNLEVYKEFIWFAESRKFEIRVAGKKEEISSYLLFGASFLVPITILSTVLLLPSVSPIIGPLCLLLCIPSMLINFYMSNKIIRKMNMKTFQKKYPDFDTTIDLEVAKLELEKYMQLAQISKEIEEKKEEHLSNCQNKCEEMSRQEKIIFLRQVKEQETTQDNFENSNEQQEKLIETLESHGQKVKR